MALITYTVGRVNIVAIIWFIFKARNLTAAISIRPPQVTMTQRAHFLNCNKMQTMHESDIYIYDYLIPKRSPSTPHYRYMTGLQDMTSHILNDYVTIARLSHIFQHNFTCSYDCVSPMYHLIHIWS